MPGEMPRKHPAKIIWLIMVAGTTPMLSHLRSDVTASAPDISIPPFFERCFTKKRSSAIGTSGKPPVLSKTAFF